MVTLPPEISVEKGPLPEGGWAHVFRHRTLGNLGRIVARDAPGGQCMLSSEVSGHPDDPMTEKRRQVFEPLAREILAEMNRLVGSGDTTVTPMPPPGNGPGKWLENKLLQCHRCDTVVARLVFAPEATDEGRFEDYARMLFGTFREMDVPTWIIGPDLDGGPPEMRPADIMQVWPVRGRIRRRRPAEFSPELDAIQEGHCRPDRAERRRRERDQQKRRVPKGPYQS
jgi:hypothetical protein